MAFSRLLLGTASRLSARQMPSRLTVCLARFERNVTKQRFTPANYSTNTTERPSSSSSEVVSDLVKETMGSMTGEIEPTSQSTKRESGSGRQSNHSKPRAKKVQSSIDKKRDRMANIAAFASLVIMAGWAMYLSRPYDSIELKYYEADENDGAFKRLKTRTGHMVSFISEPSMELLPDVRGTFVERPYTLVLELEGLLIKSTWDRENGWRVAKRPGLDFFLTHLQNHFELVLFTEQWDSAAAAVVQSLDPVGIIPHKLFRSSIKNENGKLIKDLSRLNRDLKHVIALDVKEEHVSKQPDNAIILTPWNGDPNDRELWDLIPFFEAIVANQTDDIPKVLKSYEGKHVATEYMRREALTKQQLREKWEGEQKKRSGFSGLFSSSSNNPGQGKDAPPMLPVEVERAFWRDHTRKLQGEIKRELELQKKQLEDAAKAGYKLTAADMFKINFLGEAPPPLPQMPSSESQQHSS